MKLRPQLVQLKLFELACLVGIVADTLVNDCCDTLLFVNLLPIVRSLMGAINEEEFVSES